jgi:hypothetical protein
VIGSPMIACPPDVDPLEFMLRSVEAVVHEDGWDAPHRLFLLESAPDLAGAPPDMKSVGVREAPFTEDTARMHPVAMLALATAATIIIGIPEPAFAVVMVFESWMVAQPDDPAEVAKLDADRVARQLHTRADRVEQRMAHLVTVDGSREVVLIRRRGEGPVIDPPGEYTGTVPDALRRFAQAVEFASSQ